MKTFENIIDDVNELLNMISNTSHLINSTAKVSVQHQYQKRLDSLVKDCKDKLDDLIEVHDNEINENWDSAVQQGYEEGWDDCELNEGENTTRYV